MRLRKLAFLCISGMALNFLGIALSFSLQIPVMFDSLGTIFIAALSGYLPGVTVAFCTSIGLVLLGSPSLDYGTVSVITALCAAFFAKRGLFRKYYTRIIISMFFALTQSVLVLGLAILFENYNFSMDSLLPVMNWLKNHTGLEEFACRFLTVLGTDFLNKTVSVIITALALRYFPERLRYQFASYDQKYELIRREIIQDNKHRLSVRKLSLNTKVTCYLGFIMLLVMCGSTFTAYLLYKDYSIKNHIVLGKAIARLAANAVNPHLVDTYLNTRVKTGSYVRSQRALEQLKKSSPEINFVYVYKILEDGCHVIFDVDTPNVPASDLGDVVEFDEAFKIYLPDLLAGKAIEPVITDDKYGWLLTIYEPVYDDHGICRCYAAADISMTMLTSESLSYWFKIISIFAGFFIMLCLYGFAVAEHNLTLPINTIAIETGAFAYSSKEAREISAKMLQNLDIKTGDEIENLYVALTKTICDTVQYINDVQAKNAVIGKMQAGLIRVMAELVESRDKNTGTHIRNTSAYVEVIARKMQSERIYPDAMTEEFIQDVIRSAPLHDIGKIHIPDAILNKPGKLTNEEFSLMKTHTTIGKQIIDNVIKIVPDPGYLKEARNLAAYHHEKWDGSGYPEGRAGSDIPLSARIMAVADVFDALVSKRSYKDGFPFEKALAIMREGFGTHFDPQVLQAFLDSEAVIRRISENNQNAII